MKRIHKLIKGKTGESLVESLISITILSLLIATVTLTIATGLRITDQATQDAENAQERVNEIVQGDFTTVPDPTDPDADYIVETVPVEVTMTFEIITSGIPEHGGTFSGTQEVEINNEEGKLAFRPR